MSNDTLAVTQARERLSDREQMLDAQAQCVPCKLCGGSAVISDAGTGAGYYIRCSNWTNFRPYKGCLIEDRRVSGWAYNVMDWWNRLHALSTPAIDASRVERLREALERIADDCSYTIDFYERNGPTFTSPSGAEYELTSYVQAKLSELREVARAALTPPADASEGEATPIPMILHCPCCHVQHVDEPEGIIGTGGFLPEEPGDTWDNPPHRSHLCHACGCIWRPADVPTEGVASIETVGKADNWLPTNASEPAIAEGELDRAVRHVRRWLEPNSTLIIDVDEGLEAHRPTLEYVIDMLETRAARAAVRRDATPTPSIAGEELREARSTAEFQQMRGRLPDLIEEAIGIHGEFMKDDAYDAYGCLDRIVAKLKTGRDFYPAALPVADTGGGVGKSQDMGASLQDQALAVPVEPASGLAPRASILRASVKRFCLAMLTKAATAVGPMVVSDKPTI